MVDMTLNIVNACAHVKLITWYMNILINPVYEYITWYM
jgi:hypothetical protein